MNTSIERASSVPDKKKLKSVDKQQKSKLFIIP